MKKNTKKWSERFSEPTKQIVKRYTASVNFDSRLALVDIEGSLVHAEMLKNQKIILTKDFKAIQKGLNQIKKEIIADRFKWSLDLEDVHLNIEKRLIEIIGEPGKKLHTGRSRNDQVSTDMRIYVRNATDHIVGQIKNLQRATIHLAEENIYTIMPGLTHLQVAQPVSFAHHLLAYYEMLERDVCRFNDLRLRMNLLPLGAAALAGTSYPINRNFVAKKLGFDGVMQNSMDAVSDRDFLIEFNAAASILMMHLSRWAEELIMWSSPFFKFVEISDGFCTGSSIMPQKKNPDVPELIRGKFGRVAGAHTALISIMKSQPLAYNKDNQEDKEPLFDIVDTIKDCLYAYAQMIPAIKCNRGNMENAALKGFATATDLADYLVKKGATFRDAHEIVGNVVSYAIREKMLLTEIPFSKLVEFASIITEDVSTILTLEGSVRARNHFGGTSPEQVLNAVTNAKILLDQR